MISFEEFHQLVNNTFVDFDGQFGPQCYDLAQFWSRSLGGPQFSGEFAYQIFDQAGDFYDRIENTPEGVPQKGDIVVWAGAFNGGAGHVGVSNGIGDIGEFEVLEQNDPLGARVQIKRYNYDHVLGWLHPKAQPQETAQVSQEELDQLRADRDVNWNAVVELINALGVAPNPDDKAGMITTALEKIQELKSMPSATPSAQPIEEPAPEEHHMPTLKKLLSEIHDLLNTRL